MGRNEMVTFFTRTVIESLWFPAWFTDAYDNG
jgi:hypothetical protein